MTRLRQTAPRALLDALQQLAPYSNVSLHSVALRSNDIVAETSSSWDAAAVQNYLGYYHTLNPWRDAHVGAAPGRIYRADEFGFDVAKDHPEFFHDWAAPNGVGAGAALKLSADYGYVTSYTFDCPTRLSDKHIEDLVFTLNAYKTDAARAFMLISQGMRADASRRLADVLIEDRDDPTFLIRADRTILSANEQAEALLAKGEIARADLRRRLCLAGCPKEELEIALAQARLAPKEQMVLPVRDRPPPEPARIVTVIPVEMIAASLVWGATSAAFLLSIVDANSSAVPPAVEVAQLQYGLTPKEAAVAVALCEGLSVEEIAHRACRSDVTIRNHIKRCLPKVGVHSQKDLVLVLTGLKARPKG